MLSLIGYIFFGLIVGTLARFLMPGKDPGGFLITVALGIGGAVVGGFLGRMLGLYAEGQPAGWVMATIGAILILAIRRQLIKS
jgi:uncharacterized membrane protein YeaQ/YmgE (transglycosylase-associated protein family)